MKILKLIPAVFLASLLCGCFGTEPNDISYAIAIGFDKAADSENYNITLQFAKPTQISGGSSDTGGSAGPQIVENITVEAPTLYSAVNLADGIVSKHFFLSHANLIVFSKEVAEEGIGDIMEMLARSYDIRPNVYMAVSLEGAEKYLSEVKPVLEVNPAKYYQLTYEANGAGGVPKSIIEEFYFMEDLPDIDSVVPIAGVIKSENESESSDSGESEESGSSSESGESSDGGEEQESVKNVRQSEAPLNNGGFEYKIKEYLAGEVALTEKNKSEAMGMAVFKRDKMVGVFSGIESELYNIMSGGHRDLYISLEGTEQKPVTVLIRDENEPRINVDVKNKKVDIKLYLESDLYSVPANYDIENNKKEFEESARRDIKEACEKLIKKSFSEYDADILGLTRKAKRKFLTYNDFTEANIDKEIKNYDINVDVKFNVRRTGLIISGEGGE